MQEPKDFTVQPEHWCADYKLSDQEMYLGLTKEEAIDCFYFVSAPDTKLVPQVVKEEAGVTVENLVGPQTTECFVINRILLDGGCKCLKISDSYGVYIVTEGYGLLEGDGYCREVKKGDYFFMPACVMGKYRLSGKLQCVEYW